MEDKTPIYVGKEYIDLAEAKKIVAATGRVVISVHSKAKEILDFQKKKDVLDTTMRAIGQYPEIPALDDDARCMKRWAREALEKCKIIDQPPIDLLTDKS